VLAGARLDRVEGGGSRCNGPTRSRSQDVTVKRLGHDTGPTDNANGSIGGSILYSPFIRDRANLTLPHLPMTADTPITSVTSHASLRHPESTFNQCVHYMSAKKRPPVLTDVVAAPVEAPVSLEVSAPPPLRRSLSPTSGSGGLFSDPLISPLPSHRPSFDGWFGRLPRTSRATCAGRRRR
jgi:hypothetical protein